LSKTAAAFAPHEQDTPDMTIRVDAGLLWINNDVVEVNAQSTTTISSPATYSRIDRIVIGSTAGTVSVITGVSAATPTAPTITSGKLPICQVTIATSTTAITNDLITDERIGGGSVAESIAVDGIYLETAGVDPATTLGYGTWELGNLLGLTYSIYPPAYSDTYVKATSYTGTYYPHLATDPTTNLTAAWGSQQWLTLSVTNQRFHIDLGSAKKAIRVYYENSHNSGSETDTGVKNFTLWGSNNAAAFAELTYGTDTNWTQLTCSASQFLQHTAAAAADPHYFNVSNTEAYRYYAFKFADNWGNGSNLGLRRVELQTVDLFDWKRSA
jgi:hypothetical protein